MKECKITFISLYMATKIGLIEVGYDLRIYAWFYLQVMGRYQLAMSHMNEPISDELKWHGNP